MKGLIFYQNNLKRLCLLGFLFVFFILLLSLTLFPRTVRADTHTAVDCSYTAVSAAVAAASDGDTVYVPAGSCTWSSTLTLTKHVSLIGGYDGGTTTITAGIEPALSMIPSTEPSNILQRVSNFTFDGARAYTPVWIGYYRHDEGLGQPMSNVRMDHSIFQNCGAYYAIWNGGGVYGVIDNCRFGSADNGITRVVFSHSNWDDACYSTAPQMYWEPGTNQSLYFEDNIFYIKADTGRVVTHNWAGRGVYRYNTVNLLGFCQGIFELHGHQGDDDIAAMPATFGIEAYGNLILNAGNLYWIMETRGGSSMVFYNTTIGSTPATQAYAGTAVTCPATAPNEQMIHDTYVWNNRANYTGATGTLTIEMPLASCGGLLSRPTAGRDVFNESTTIPGITSGPLASLPGTCAVGQGYWATSQTTSDLTNYVGDIVTYSTRQMISGTLYKCTAPNTWTSYYTPYTYPHPLRSEITPSFKRGDLNEDGRVDVIDLGILLLNWGSTSRPAADINQDGRVDVIDFGILLSNWG
jgi:hypothetical protein